MIYVYSMTKNFVQIKMQINQLYLTQFVHLHTEKNMI